MVQDAWRRGVVVGIDGSQEGLHAFDWAVTIADRHGTTLRAVYAQAVPVGPIAPVAAYSPEFLRGEAEAIVRDALQRHPRRPPGGREIEPSVSIGPADAVLVALSREADLIVVGQHGAGGHRGGLGSVSAAVAARAHGPVAIIPTTARGLTPDRIVVGVGLADDPEPALDFAYAEALCSHRPIEVVHALEPPSRRPRGRTHDRGRGREEASVHAELNALVDRWTARFPDIECHASARRGEPIDVLLDQVTAFDVLVLGGRPHPRAVGRLRGSVPDRAVVAAPCAIVVVHSRERTSEPTPEHEETVRLERRPGHDLATSPP